MKKRVEKSDETLSFEQIPTVEMLVKGLKGARTVKRGFLARFTDWLFAIELGGTFVLGVLAVCVYLQWAQRDTLRPWAQGIFALIFCAAALATVCFVLFALFIVASPNTAYAKSLQDRLTAERKLQNRLSSIQPSTLLKLSQRLELESRMVVRRASVASVIVASASLMVSLSSQKIGLTNIAPSLSGMLPFIVAFATGGSLAAMLLQNILENLDRAAFVLKLAAERNQRSSA